MSMPSLIYLALIGLAVLLYLGAIDALAEDARAGGSVNMGAGLALAGVVMQILVRNLLADPYLLGVSSGASVGATAVITIGVFTSFGD